MRGRKNERVGDVRGWSGKEGLGFERRRVNRSVV